MNSNLETKWEGIVTAVSSIVHGGQSLGTVQYLRREKFLLPNGEIDNIPVISGNAVRGAIRDHSADMYHSFLDHRDLTLPQAQLLWSGGSITKARSEPLSGQRLREVREVCPPFALLGGGIAGRVVSGSASVGKMIPLCSELVHILPEEHREESLPSYWDLTQLEEFSRFPDLDEKDDDKTQLMRFGVESFIPGTRFYWWTKADTRNNVEQLFYIDVLRKFLTGKIQLGGLKSKGFGQLRANNPDSLPFSEQEWQDRLLSLHTMEDIIQKLGALQ